MKIYPTTKKGITIDVECSEECDLFDALIEDVTFEKARSFVTRLSNRMLDHDGWEEFVVPELETHFEQQLASIRIQLQNVFSEKPPFSIIINENQTDAWYGCLNQARLNLETTYGWSKNGHELFSEEGDEIMAHARYEFYSMLQGVLLEVGMNLE